MALAKNLSQEEAKDIAKWKKIEEANTEITLKRFIDDREVVVKRELMNLWKVDRKTIERYVKKEMPVHISSLKGFQIFDLSLCEEWRDRNVNKAQSLKTNRSDEDIEVDLTDESSEDDTIEADIDKITYQEAERQEKILKVKLAQLRLDKENGLVVEAEDLDKSMSEQATIHYSDIANDEKIFPILLEKKSAQEIAVIYKKHKQERKQMLEKIVQKVFKSDETLYDIVQKVLEELSDGVEPIELIERIASDI